MSWQTRVAVMVIGCMSVVSSALAGQAPPGSASTGCPMASDPEFGRVATKAVPVGGGAFYVVARERAYLDTLRGPGGEVLTYTRLGASQGTPGSRGPVDSYRVSYAGLDQPFTLYLDVYHFDELLVPTGLTCAPQIRFGPPPVDPFLARDATTALAIEQGADRTFDGIPLGANGSTTHGVAFDRFRLIARASFVAKAAGSAMPEVRTSQAGLVVVAYPLDCDGRAVVPELIEIVPRQGPPVQRRGALVSGDQLGALVPGLATRVGALAADFGLATFRPVDVVRITYAGETCGGTERVVSLPVSVTGSRGVIMPRPRLPEAASATTRLNVWIQAVVDHEGRLHATFLGGPEALRDAALVAVKEWRAEPARINTAPVVGDTLAVIQFVR
jgi:hypothetical protein